MVLFPAEYISLNVGPEFRSQVAQQIETEPDGALFEPKNRLIETGGIPQVGKELFAVSAADAPGGESLAARIGPRENGSSDGVPGPAPEPRIAQSIVARVLVERRVQAK